MLRQGSEFDPYDEKTLIRVFLCIPKRKDWFNLVDKAKSLDSLKGVKCDKYTYKYTYFIIYK